MIMIIYDYFCIIFVVSFLEEFFSLRSKRIKKKYIKNEKTLEINTILLSFSPFKK